MLIALHIFIHFFSSDEVENQIRENNPMSVDVTGAVNKKSQNTGENTNHSILKKNFDVISINITFKHQHIRISIPSITIVT